MNSARDFRVLVFEVAEKLAYSDCETLRFIYGLPEKTGAARLEVLRTLHRQGVFTDPRGLAEVLRTAHREDLAMEVESYKWLSPHSSLCSPASSSPVSSESDLLYFSPTQLRGMCDANTAQTNSLAAELGRVRESIPSSSSGVSRDALERLHRELLEVEGALQAALGRCENMKACCSMVRTVAGDEDLTGSGTYRDLVTTAAERRVVGFFPVRARPRVRNGNSIGSAVLFKSSSFESEEAELLAPACHIRSSSSCLELAAGKYSPRKTSLCVTDSVRVPQHYRKCGLGHIDYHNQPPLGASNVCDSCSVSFMSRSCSNGRPWRPQVPKKPGNQ